MRTLAAIAVAAVLLVGTAIPPAAASAHTRWSERDVIRALKLKRSESGIGYTMAQGCQIAVILNTPTEIALYADAGDTVATNPARTAGVKVVGEHEHRCYRQAKRKLRTLR